MRLLSNKNIFSENLILKLFWIAFLIYTVSYTIMISGISISRITALLQLIAIFVMFFTFVKLHSFKIKSIYFRLLITLFILWNLIVLFRGLEFEYEFFRDTIFDGSNGVFLYLAPFIVFLPFNFTNLKFLKSLLITLSVFYIVLSLISISEIINPLNVNGQIILEFLSWNLALPSGFLILLYKYISKKTFFFAGIILLTVVFLAVIRARRGLLFAALLPLIFSYFLYLFESNRKIGIVFFSILIIGFLFYFLNHTTETDKTGVFNLLSERLVQDTRSGVVQYFYYGMSDIDWIIGKGMSGKYFCPIVITEDGYRAVIETGYLQIILKGGIIQLLLYILMTIPAIYLGFFKSNNHISKVAAIWILIWVMNSYPAVVTFFNLYYILYLLSLVICYSPSLRNLPDELIIQKLKI